MEIIVIMAKQCRMEKKMIMLDYNNDDYGSVPKEIKIEKFPHKNYFIKSIDHNDIINIDGSNYP